VTRRGRRGHREGEWIGLKAAVCFDGGMDRRLLVLPVAAAVIGGMVLWRMDQETVRRNRPRPVVTPKYVRPAPSFLLTTQSGGTAKLAAYLGRTRVVLLFTGGEVDLAANPLLDAINRASTGIAAAGAQVLVVTPAPPQEVRRLQEAKGRVFPFPVFSDIDPRLGVPTPAHQMWGLAPRPDRPVKAGLFLIDRAGYTEFSQRTETAPGRPVPVADPVAILNRLSQGEWPM
jgi:peroxiredoxin